MVVDSAGALMVADVDVSFWAVHLWEIMQAHVHERRPQSAGGQLHHLCQQGGYRAPVQEGAINPNSK